MGINKPRFDAWNYYFYALFLMVLPYLESLISDKKSRTNGITIQKRITSFHSRSRPAIRIDRSGVAERANNPEPCYYELIKPWRWPPPFRQNWPRLAIPVGSDHANVICGEF
jgi:hypothetical protein